LGEHVIQSTFVVVAEVRDVIAKRNKTANPTDFMMRSNPVSRPNASISWRVAIN